jgi:hypothetical protein
MARLLDSDTLGDIAEQPTASLRGIAIVTEFPFTEIA